MKVFLLSLFTLLISSHVHAEELLPPFAESPFSINVQDRVSKEPLPEGNWAFDVTIHNPNNRDLYCKNTPFLARMALSNTLCAQPDFASYIYPASESKGFLVPASGKLQFAEAGYAERLGKNEETKLSLEFCGREGWNLDCGFVCPNGKVLGETWEEKINDSGMKKFVCQRDGTPLLQEVRCDSQHAAGSTWSVEVPNGMRYLACQASGEITSDLRCSQVPAHYAKNDACIPIPCENTIPSGQRYVLTEFSLGKQTALCEAGFPVDKKIECDANAIKENDMCRPARICSGNVKHGALTIDSPKACPASCTKLQTTYQCSDGTLTKQSSREVGCRPARGNCA